MTSMTLEQIKQIIDDIDNPAAANYFYFTYQGALCTCASYAPHGIFLYADSAANDHIFTPRGPLPSVEAAKAFVILLGGEIDNDA